MSQIKIVKGNDAPIQWRVSYQGQPLDLTGKAVTLYVINSRGPFQLKGFEVDGNVVTATYYGADQTRFGEHSLVLRLNEGRPEMSTVAVKEAFELVEWSKDQGGESGEPIKVTPVILEADVAIAQGGSGGGGDVDLSDYYTKDEANATFQPKGNYQPAGDYATTEELTELSTEVSGLSEDVANKQDEIADLETIRSGASKGATAIQEVKTINGQSIVGSGNITIEGGGGSADLSAIAKWGVKTQDLKREGSADTGYRNVVSNPQYGWIPQQFIDQVSDQYAVEFNEGTGYFEYDDITNLSYEDVRLSIASCSDFLTKSMYAIDNDLIIYNVFGADNNSSDTKVRLVLVPKALLTEQNINNIPFRWWLRANKPMIMLEIVNNIRTYSSGASVANLFNCQSLRKAGYYNYAGVGNNRADFKYNYSLEEVWIKSLGFNLSIAYSPLLKNECILYMIQNAGATGITITLHPTAYDRAMADAEIVAAMESKQVNLAKA